MKNLGKLDVVILRELLREGRQSFTALAKLYGTSKDVIWKHFKDMEKAGIIVGATIQYNYPSFGYEGVGSILANVESQHISEVIARLRKYPFIRCFRQYNSPYNIGIITNLRKLSDIDVIKEELRRQNPVNSIRTYLWTGVRNIPENLSMGFPSKDSFHANKDAKETKFKKEFLGEKQSLKLDKVDLRIIELLTDDGKIAFSKIGKELGISTDTVSRRYARLVGADLIKVSIQINPIKLGYRGILNCYLSVSSQAAMKNTIERISRILDVSYIVKIVGEYDLYAAILIRGIEEIYQITEEIIKIHNLKKVETDLRQISEVWPGPRQYISTF